MIELDENAKRVRAFRQQLLANIPHAASGWTSVQSLHTKSLEELMAIYISWCLRHIPARPREVSGITALEGSLRATDWKPKINTFVNAVRAGNDLTPHLSLLTRHDVYEPAAVNDAETWAYKHFILNAMGFHHFHLSLRRTADGDVERTPTALFARVKREEMDIIGLYDCETFEGAGNDMTPDRNRVWEIFETRRKKMLVGSDADIVVSPNGLPQYVMKIVRRHMDLMSKIEPRLDDPNVLQTPQ